MISGPRILPFMAALFLFASSPAIAQQVADTLFNPRVGMPAYGEKAGPKVLIDEAHHNYHTMAGRYLTFARLLQKDGYVVEPQRGRFSRNDLDHAKILVIANALAEENTTSWTLPTPSAFEASEIEAVRDWVRDGGSLLLIADHMPFPGAAGALAAEFGVAMGNGYVLDIDSEGGRMRFARSDGSLVDHPVTRGRNRSERIDSIFAFTGQAFRFLDKGEPLMILGRNTKLFMPQAAAQFSQLTPGMLSGGMLQGAAITFGKGRVAIFGEASMFSAQVIGPSRSPMGFNDPSALQNPQFVLNVLHWLSGLI